jgi:hypothetical protein
MTRGGLRMTNGQLAVVVVGVAVISALLALWMHHLCTVTDGAVASPQAGTPKARWCAQDDFAYPWIFTLAPPLFVLVAGGLAARNVLLTALFVVVALLVAAFID